MPDSEAETPDSHADPVSELENIILDVGTAAAKVRLYRIPRTGTSADKAYLGTVPAPDMPNADPLEYLRQHYGGGKYWVQVVDSKGVYKGQRTVRIDGPEKDPHGQEEAEEETDAELERLRRELDAKREQLEDRSTLEVLARLMEEVRDLRRQVQNPPPQAQQQNPAELAASLIGALQSSTAPYIELLRERVGDSQGLDPSDLVDSFYRGMEMARDMHKDSQEGYGPVLRDLGRPLVKLIERQVSHGGARAVGPGPAAAPAPAPHPNPPRPEPQEDPVQDWRAMVKSIVPQLVAWAESESDPRLRAHVVADEIPQHYLEVIADGLAEENAVQTFFRDNPEAQPHAPWLRVFLDELADLLGVEPEPEPEARPEREPHTVPDDDPGDA